MNKILSWIAFYLIITSIFKFNVDSCWNVMAHGDAREGTWRGNWRMQWVASTLHNTSEHGVSSITTADAHTSAASSRLNWRPRFFKWIRPFRAKDEMWFLRVCHHISNAVYHLLNCSIFYCPQSQNLWSNFNPTVQWHTVHFLRPTVCIPKNTYKISDHCYMFRPQSAIFSQPRQYLKHIELW